MKLIDLFSGIGGFSLGLESAGFETVQFCEIKASCVRLLNHHWPHVPVHDDVSTFDADRLSALGSGPFAICGGFPCQDISLAGPGGGLDGSRSGLWREYFRIIRFVRPELVFVENSSALLGRGLGVILGNLASIGYNAWWDCIPAEAVGTNHERDRCWIIAYPGGQQYEGYSDALRRAVAQGLLEAFADAQGVIGRLGTKKEKHTRIDRRKSTDGLDQNPPDADARFARLEIVQPWKTSKLKAPVRAREWAFEPDVARVVYGVPARVDRVHGLGNAVVPLIPQILGKAALQARAEIGLR